MDWLFSDEYPVWLQIAGIVIAIGVFLYIYRKSPKAGLLIVGALVLFVLYAGIDWDGNRDTFKLGWDLGRYF